MNELDAKRKAFVISTLRRASYRWFPRSGALALSRIARGLYICNICQLVFEKKHTALDHKDPVVDPVKGFTNWDDYINRLYCSETGFQVLCLECHKTKTAKEKEIRNLNKPKKKKKRNKKK